MLQYVSSKGSLEMGLFGKVLKHHCGTVTTFFPVGGDSEGKKVMRNGVKAAEMFCMIESLTQNVAPFTWLFIRPPWSLNGACCKECVFTYMKNYLKKVGSASLSLVCNYMLGIHLFCNCYKYMYCK